MMTFANMLELNVSTSFVDYVSMICNASVRAGTEES